jgi:hypothetical protein
MGALGNHAWLLPTNRGRIDPEAEIRRKRVAEGDSKPKPLLVGDCHYLTCREIRNVSRPSNFRKSLYYKITALAKGQYFANVK